jgi:hypothetical protein
LSPQLQHEPVTVIDDQVTGAWDARRRGKLKVAIEQEITDAQGAEPTGMSLRHFKKRLKRGVGGSVLGNCYTVAAGGSRRTRGPVEAVAAVNHFTTVFRERYETTELSTSGLST